MESTVLPRISGAEIGILVVETIAKIRRAHFVQGKPIKQICRELKRLLAEAMLDSEPLSAIGPRTMASALKDRLSKSGDARREA